MYADAFKNGCLLLAACSLFAGTALADSGVYVGAAVGQSRINEPGDEEEPEFDETETGFKVMIGYRASPYLGIETAYTDTGSIKNVETTPFDTLEVELQTTLFSVSILPTLPLGEYVSLFARAGYTWYDAEVTLNSTRFPSMSAKESFDDFLYGGGIAVKVVKGLELRAEYEAVNAPDDVSIEFISVGATWKF